MKGKAPRRPDDIDRTPAKIVPQVGDEELEGAVAPDPRARISRLTGAAAAKSTASTRPSRRTSAHRRQVIELEVEVGVRCRPSRHGGQSP